MECKHQNTVAVAQDPIVMRCRDCGFGQDRELLTWFPPESDSFMRLVDSLLESVAAFAGEAMGGDTFCGFGVDVIRGAGDIIQGLQIVACDLVGGEPVRRLDKFEKKRIVSTKSKIVTGV